MSQTHIVIIGAGNVAYHLANSFRFNKNANLIQFFNHRNSADAKKLAKHFRCDLVTEYSALSQKADLYIIAVKDDAIAEVVKNLAPLKLKGTVVHTSGSMDMAVLKNVSPAIGVYYPLQTFYKGAEIDWKMTPVLLEANSKTVLNKLKAFASAISGMVKTMDSKSRLQVHLAAVFACNFTNALYASAYGIIENNLSKKDVDLLQPIMLHSFQKLQTVHPKAAQTGPAKRNDRAVMKKHLALLKDQKQLSVVYKTLSDLIMSQQNSK